MSGDRPGLPRREGRPPEAAFFAGLWKPLGFRSAAIDLGGLSIRFDGMDEAWWTAFRARYAPFARDTTSDGGAFTLTLSASRDRRQGSRPHYIDPPEDGRAERNPVFVEVEPLAGARGGAWTVRACTYRLAISFPSAGGRGFAIFAAQDLDHLDPRERAVENMVRVAAAWLALSRGGLLMHAASIVKDGKARLFFGQSGSGKSTIAAGSRRGQVVSDDLTLILPDAAGRPEVVGAPFRGTYEGGAAVQGRFPIVAAFRLRKSPGDQPAAVERLPPAAAMADAIANAPFVVDQLAAHPELFEYVERVLRAIPIRALRFRREDDSWWEAVESAGL